MKKPTRKDLRISELRSWISHNEELIKRIGDHPMLVASIQQDIKHWKEELASLGYREKAGTKTCSSEGIFFEVAA